MIEAVLYKLNLRSSDWQFFTPRLLRVALATIFTSSSSFSSSSRKRTSATTALLPTISGSTTIPSILNSDQGILSVLKSISNIFYAPHLRDPCFDVVGIRIVVKCLLDGVELSALAAFSWIVANASVVLPGSERNVSSWQAER